jgi:hypothetical protein
MPTDTPELLETSPTPASETPATLPVTPPVPTVEQLLKENEDLKRHSKNKEEEAARVHKENEMFRKQDEDRKKAELTEVDRLKAEKAEAETKRTEAEKLLVDERAKVASEKAFSAVVGKLKIVFANDKARENVYKQMDVANTEEYEEAIKKIMTDEPYYFKAIEVPELDAISKGKKPNGVLNDADKEALKKRFHIK